jgi:iron complex outermembrane receptor protein
LLSSAGAYSANPEIDLADLSLEELMNIKVTGASKFEQTVSEAPSSVSIVTADEIKKYGYRTVAEILKSIQGFHITYDRNYTYIGMRGFGRTGDYNSRFLLLIDGHRVNDNIYDSLLIGTDFILDIDLIDRIEIIRGPASSLYGSNAFFGIINIITKNEESVGRPEVSGEAGSFDTYKGRFSYGNTFRNGLDIIISGSIYDSKGQDLFYKEFDSPDTNNGIAQNCDYDRNYSLFSKLKYKGFTLEGAYVSRTKGIPTGAYETDFNDSRNRTVDALGYADLRYEHRFENALSLTARLFYDNYTYEGGYIYSGILNKDLGKGEWWGGEVTVEKVVFNKHRITAGAEYRVNSKQDQMNYDEEPYALKLDDRSHSDIWAIYAQDEYRLRDNLILSAGIRHDHYDTFGGTTNPRVALIYKPFEETILKLLYGTAFRAPNAYELYYSSDSAGQKGNPDLKPEEIKTYEVVYEQGIGRNIKVTAAGYYYKIENHITEITDPSDNLSVFVNSGEVEAKGLELELEGKWENGLHGRISYTYQDAKDNQTKEWLVNSPRHLAKINLIVPLYADKVFAGAEVQYMSKRKTLKGQDTGEVVITNITLFSQRILKGLELSASVYNFFDKKYGDPGGEEHLQDVIRQDGRNFRVKLTYAF